MEPRLAKRNRAIVGAVSAPLLLAGMVGTAASSPAALLQVRVPAAPIDDQVDAANNGLKAAKHALVRAQATLDQAASALPQAEQRVQQALAALAQAQAAEARAREAVAAAQKAVAAQRVKIAKTQGEIDALKVQIAGLARQAYTNGGEYQELEILLESQDPSQFAAQLHAVRRQARSNSGTLDQIVELKQELQVKFAELAALEASAKASQQEADDNQAKAQSSKDDAAAAQQQVQQLVAKRQSAVAEADATRTKLKGIYLGLLAEQRRLAQEAARKNQIGSAAWAGQEAAAARAVSFAVSQVGHRYNPNGGTGPSYGCNGFSWRAWHEAGSKWPLLMAQDQSTSKYTQKVALSAAKPGDVIFWRMNNGTDWRENAIDHVGIIVDPASGKFVHAANSHDGVKLSNYKTEAHYGDVAAVVRVIR
ncbi:MAG: Chromosome partition protein Smc [Alphaproteobacteria bacterium ADurb.BinA280]|nr:MAG: Chromosome partition protein Smc [Alphaproteobacteria bacterium ADurb.BinA280]